ncbi:MAG TPA: hypothetical protein DD713_02885 [Nitrospiraceae bacterium]|nr:hypothetical protein [Nitrospiraceae bacterium]
MQRHGILGGLGKPQEAIACFDKALEINPGDAEAWLNKGVALLGIGKAPEAIKAFNCFIKFAPPQDAERVSKAKEIIQKIEVSLAEDKDAETWYEKGTSLDILGKPQEAIACYNKALEINPRHAGAWFWKAIAEDEIGLNQDAIFSYRRFIELAPTQDAEQSEIEYARQRLLEKR